MYGEENIIRSDPRRRDTPHPHCDFVPLTKRGNLSAKDDMTKKMRRTQEYP